MGARRTARERVLQALYGLELTPREPLQALEQAWYQAAQELYQQPEASGPHPEDASGAGPTESGDSVDETVEADYEVVDDEEEKK